METPETIRTSLQQGEWVTSIDFKDAYFHIPIQEQSRKYLRFHAHGQTYQFKALPFGLSTAPLEFTVVAKEVKLMAIDKGIRIHQYLDDWLVRATSHQVSAYSRSSEDMPRTRLVGEFRKIRTGTQTDLRLCRLPIRPQGRSGPTHTGPLAEPSGQNTGNAINTGLSGLAVHVLDRFIDSHRKTSSPRPTTYKTHTVASQKELGGTRVSGEGDPNPKVPAPPLTMVARGRQRSHRPTSTPNKTCSANFYRRIKEGWGAHLNERTARGTWPLPESKLHINYLELKAVFLALKEFQDLCLGKIVLVATDNTTVVSYINKVGGRRSGPLCALLWRILTWCTRNQVTLKARHIPGRLNVVADKLSRLGQTIQTEWSLLPEVFQKICSR